MGLGTMLAAFAAGLLSFFSPCVAPLIPGYLGYISGSQLSAAPASVSPGGEAVVTARRPVLANPMLVPCLLFVAGFSLAFVALGVASASAGRLIAAYTPVLETIAGIVMIAMGAFLLNWLPAPVMAWLARERRLHLPAGRLQGAGTWLRWRLGSFLRPAGRRVSDRCSAPFCWWWVPPVRWLPVSSYCCSIRPVLRCRSWPSASAGRVSAP